MIVNFNVMVDGLDKLFDAFKGAAPYSLLGDLREPALHHVQPGTSCRRKVLIESGMFFQPVLNLGAFVRSIIVNDQVQLQSGWRLAVDLR